MEKLKPNYVRVSHVLSMIPKMTWDEEKGEPKFSFPLEKLKEEKPEVLSRKAKIGTNVHEAIAAHCNGEFCPLEDSEKGYFESFIKWSVVVGLKAIETEMRLYDDKTKLTGCIDMLGQFSGSDSWRLIDFKTTVAEDKDKWPLQAALYELILINSGIHVDQVAVFVKLDKDGKLPTVYEYNLRNTYTRTAISALNLFWHLHKSAAQVHNGNRNERDTKYQADGVGSFSL